MYDYERLEFVLQEMDGLQEFAAVVQIDAVSMNDSNARGSNLDRRRPDEVKYTRFR